ncbi:S8 family serine peptidase [Hoyosella rhizosphaerae]|uniref:Peptidase S8 n=1 Tax=Hoyosella rhizosphaerae TaxID=1755582 RepID=A0A916XAS5_9ACTN|nr:S8 family serine peptidase [Hoyosella rhizosphaerae]MBN4926715.1 S8 family serine peptidase [Hoyosella rhizosphaerae]GGC56992.1 hypothetical protein GCM10011410_06910 [Hoyosella rhizosphaerae]
MRRSLLGIVATSVLAGGLVVVGAPAAVSEPPDESYIVVFNDNVEQAPKVRALERANGIATDREFRNVLNGFSARMPGAVRDRLAQDPDVAFIAPDLPVRALPSDPVQSGENVPTGVKRIEAESAGLVNKPSNVSVAIIDTGIDLAHSDLNAVAGKDCITNGGTSQDTHGHGTHVAGTVAARNNGAGVVGVVPDTTVYSVRVLNSEGDGTISSVICGIDWVTENSVGLNIKVANMSLGTVGSSDGNCGATKGDPMHLAVCQSTQQGITYVVAAGNDATDFATAIPAAYPEVLTVTAMSDSDGAPGGTGGAPSCSSNQGDDVAATFSNYATSTVDRAHTVAAPGVCIASTRRGGGTTLLSGTSMAAPHVAGAVAKCIGTGGIAGPCDGMTPAQIIQKIRSDAAAKPASFGFTGDAVNSPTAKHYGRLVHVGVGAGDGSPTDPEPTDPEPTDPGPSPTPPPCQPTGSFGGGC